MFRERVCDVEELWLLASIRMIHEAGFRIVVDPDIPKSENLVQNGGDDESQD